MSGGVAASPLPPALAARLREAPLPEAEPGYWAAVARTAALGWVDACLDLLGLHSAWLRFDGGAAALGGDDAARGVVGALEAATLLLRRFPVLAAPGVVQPAGREFGGAAELLAYRRTWQAQAGALLGDARLWAGCEAGDKATAGGLRALLGVLAGDDGALAGATASWLELLVAQLLHVYPAANRQAELRQLAQRCFEAGGGGGAPEFLQAAAALLEACADLDAQAAQRVCSALCSDWFMAHAPPLMAAHAAGALLRGGVGAGVVWLCCSSALPPRRVGWRRSCYRWCCASQADAASCTAVTAADLCNASSLPAAPKPCFCPDRHPPAHSLVPLPQALACWGASWRTPAAARWSGTRSSTRPPWPPTRPPGPWPPPTWPGAPRTARRRWRHCCARCRWTPATPGLRARRRSWRATRA